MSSAANNALPTDVADTIDGLYVSLDKIVELDGLLQNAKASETEGYFNLIKYALETLSKSAKQTNSLGILVFRRKSTVDIGHTLLFGIDLANIFVQFSNYMSNRDNVKEKGSIDRRSPMMLSLMCMLVQLVFYYHELTSKHYNSLINGETKLYELITDDQYTFSLDNCLKNIITDSLKVRKSHQEFKSLIYNPKIKRSSSSATKKGKTIKTVIFNSHSLNTRGKIFGFKCYVPGTEIDDSNINDMSFLSEVKLLQSELNCSLT